MTDRLNYVILGLINQHQIWFKRYANNSNEEAGSGEQEDQDSNVRVYGGSSGAVYGLGLIGACVYYISQASNTKQKFTGFLKALVWPAYLVYELLKFLHKE